MLFGLIAFFDGDLTQRTNYLSDQIKDKKGQIQYQESRIEEFEKNIADYQQEKLAKEAELASAKDEQTKASKIVEDKKAALKQAEADLDEVCDNSYYSSWSCKAECKDLHTAVSTKNTELTNATKALNTANNKVSTIEDNINSIGRKIDSAKEDIVAAQDRIAELKVDVKDLKGKLAGARFAVFVQVVALLLALGGLGLLAKNFHNGTQDKFTLYAVAGLGASSILFLISGAAGNALFKNAPLLYLLINPHTWGLAVMAMFAVILLEKTEKLVMVRNIAVVFAVIMGLVGIATGTHIVGVLYAAAMICTAFMFVPLVFTEYIDIAKHIFLSVITFGVWQLVWVYHVTKNLNKVEAVEERKPARELLLSLFLIFYYPYWLYKTAEGVEDYGKEKGKEFKIDILCLAFSFISPVFATVLIQNKINVVVGKPVCEEIKAPVVAQIEEAEEADAAEATEVCD